jgi:single-strand DNA-binding protein
MSLASTQITVVGKVVTDIATRLTSAGHKVANFRLACQERNYDKAQDLWVDGDRMYLSVACWRNLADHVTASLHKGDQVVVHGRMKIEEYQTKEGAHRTDLVVDAKAIGPDLALHTVMVNRPDWGASTRQQQLLEPRHTPPDLEPIPKEELTKEDVAHAA